MFELQIEGTRDAFDKNLDTAIELRSHITVEENAFQGLPPAHLQKKQVRFTQVLGQS